MSKILKDEKIFNDFKKSYKFIFSDKNLLIDMENSFDKKGCLPVFTIAFLENKIGKDIIAKNIKINKDEWINLFDSIYIDNDIKSSWETINLNPITKTENIEKYFVCFKKYISDLLSLVEQLGWDLQLTNSEVNQLLTSCFGYFMYNYIECKLPRYVSKVVEDPTYDQKYLIVLNNTKLFSKAKNNILNMCDKKINDLIVILLGGSNHLALDK